MALASHHESDALVEEVMKVKLVGSCDILILKKVVV